MEILFISFIFHQDGQDSIAMATENEQQTAVRIIQNYLLECDCDETASRCEERDKTMVTWTFSKHAPLIFHVFVQLNPF